MVLRAPRVRLSKLLYQLVQFALPNDPDARPLVQVYGSNEHERAGKRNPFLAASCGGTEETHWWRPRSRVSRVKARQAKPCCGRLQCISLATSGGPAFLGKGANAQRTPISRTFAPPPLPSPVSLLELLGACCDLQCFSGFELLDLELWRTLYVALVAVMVILFLLLQLAAFVKSKVIQNVGVRQLSGPQTRAATGTSH